VCTKGLLLNEGKVKFIGTTEDTIKAYVMNRVNAAAKKELFKPNAHLYQRGKPLYEKWKSWIPGEGCWKTFITRKISIFKLEIEVVERIKDALLDIKGDLTGSASSSLIPECQRAVNG